ncbi:MAG: hypothetical protein RIT03_740 [Bacteroidota bacterium]|jgi:hypothetical protein
MCTVSFVQTAAGVLITSNRDEHVLRSAEFPQTHILNKQPITFPKDPMAGGTWFAIAHESGRVVVLLNGAEHKHERVSSYRKSRGLVLLDLISAEADVCTNWEVYNLQEIEPFTLVVFENQMLFQLRWDGAHKSRVALETANSYIWSSATLYSPAVRDQRQAWFTEFLSQHSKPNSEDLIHFHRSSPTTDKQSNFMMERSAELKTISITQVVIGANQLQLKHCDLLSQQTETYLFDSLNPSL